MLTLTQDSIDDQDGNGLRTSCESTGLVGDFLGSTHLGQHPDGNQHAIDCPHHLGCPQIQQRGDITVAGRFQKRLHALGALSHTAELGGPGSLCSRPRTQPQLVSFLTVSGDRFNRSAIVSNDTANTL
uniref:Uncharacterized protein n=1 Tax=Mycobacterium leprae TaxID=1769 RepID=O32938_MYCLR|nr:hypothetical protein [Mycobacterium leprae]